MEKMICIPVWRYELMLKTFDEALKELEELKKALAEAGTSAKAEYTRKHSNKPDTGCIISYPAAKRKDFLY